MSLSTQTLATLEARIARQLTDAAQAIWALTQLDEAIRLAMEEYSRARPAEAIGTLTFGSATREIALSSLTGLVYDDADDMRVWFPYIASFPLEYDILKLRSFEVYDNAGTLTLRINDGPDPQANDVARIWYKKLHTLNGLDSASATTWSASDDGIIVLGACGYACLQKSVDLNETPGNMSVSTPNYGTLAQMYLDRFDLALSETESHGLAILPGYIAQRDERGR